MLVLQVALVLLIKLRLNDRKISMQHISTLFWAAFCAHLATQLRHVRYVGCCWFKFENGQIFYATFVDVA